MTGGLRQREKGLTALIPNRSVAKLVLMIAGRWHPRTLAGAAAVVLPEIPPGSHPILGDIRITEIAVQQMKQGLQPLYAENRIGGRRRAQLGVRHKRCREL